MNHIGKTFSLWTKYGALNSKPVFDAFRQGAQSLGFNTVDNSTQSDIDVIWSVLFNGRMAGNKHIWERNLKTSKPTIVLEVGGIKRGTTWKVGLNGINRDAYFGDMGNNSDRANIFDLKVKPWRTDGEYILICGQHDKSLQWIDMPKMSEWVVNTIKQLQIHYDLPIVLRPHPRCPLPHLETEFKNVVRQEPCHINGTYDDFDLQFNNVKYTISWSSNPGIHSIINGVPAHVGPSSLAFDVGCPHLLMVDNPSMPDRQQWLNDYAWTEFTLEEISNGIPIKRLTNRI
jgi:hypothetical protein